MAKSKETLAEVITNARIKKGLSMRELARLSGMDHAEISRIEKGTRLKPNILFLRRLAMNLELSLVDLLTTAGYSEIDIIWGSDKEDSRTLDDLKKDILELQKVNNNVEETLRIFKNETRKVKSYIEQLIMKLEVEKDKVSNDYMLETLNKINEKITEIVRETK